MISVIEVYNNLRDYCNKDQKGFVTPTVFNSFAGLAQQQIFNAMFSALPEALNARRKGIDPSRSKSLYKQIDEDLAYFVERVNLQEGDDFGDADSAVFTKPSDLSKIISIAVNDDERTSVELLYDSEKIDRILKSNLSTPTDAFPVALIGKNIEVFPSSLDNIYITYYRQPRSKYVVTQPDVAEAGDIDNTNLPTYSVSSMNLDDSQIDIPQPSGCRDFELPEHYKTELVIAMSKFIGVSLRDEFLITKANA